MDNKIIGKHIREARLDKKLTQYQLAEKVHITPNYLSMLERGTHLPKLETLITISEALNIPVSTLLADLPFESLNSRIQFLSSALEGLTDEQFKIVCDVLKVLTDGFKKKD